MNGHLLDIPTAVSLRGEFANAFLALGVMVFILAVACVVRERRAAAPAAESRKTAALRTILKAVALGIVMAGLIIWGFLKLIGLA
jgi:hypothetical protein